MPGHDEVHSEHGAAAERGSNRGVWTFVVFVAVVVIGAFVLGHLMQAKPDALQTFSKKWLVAYVLVALMMYGGWYEVRQAKSVEGEFGGFDMYVGLFLWFCAIFMIRGMMPSDWTKEFDALVRPYNPNFAVKPHLQDAGNTYNPPAGDELRWVKMTIPPPPSGQKVKKVFVQIEVEEAEALSGFPVLKGAGGSQRVGKIVGFYEYEDGQTSRTDDL